MKSLSGTEGREKEKEELVNEYKKKRGNLLTCAFPGSKSIISWKFTTIKSGQEVAEVNDVDKDRLDVDEDVDDDAGCC